MTAHDNTERFMPVQRLLGREPSLAFMINPNSTGEDLPPVKCDGCEQAMRPSYCEALDSDRQLNIYECHWCRTTTSLVVPVSG